MQYEVLQPMYNKITTIELCKTTRTKNKVLFKL